MTVIQHVELFSSLAGRSRSLSVELADNFTFFTIFTGSLHLKFDLCTALNWSSKWDTPQKSRYIDIVWRMYEVWQTPTQSQSKGTRQMGHLPTIGSRDLPWLANEVKRRMSSSWLQTLAYTPAPRIAPITTPKGDETHLVSQRDFDGVISYEVLREKRWELKNLKSLWILKIDYLDEVWKKVGHEKNIPIFSHKFQHPTLGPQSFQRPGRRPEVPITKSHSSLGEWSVNSRWA